MTFWKWSKTAASNGTADASINFAEGMAPSGLNDSGRAVMAAAAKYRDDIAGAIVTGGTSTAYTVSSNQVFDTLAHLDGAMIAFTPHTTAGATVTLSVDGLGAKPLRSAPSTELPAGTLIQGTPYVATYSNADSAFYLHGFFGNPYSVPIGGMIDFIGPTAPNSSFVLPFGQAVSRTTYSALFAIVSTTYGTGDGSTTFNVPDLRGRVVAGADGMGGSLAGRLDATGGMNGVGIGAVGGAQTKVLVTANLPPYTPAGSVSGNLSNLSLNMRSVNTTGSDVLSSVSAGNGGGSSLGSQSGALVSSTLNAAFTGTAQGGTSTGVQIAQPTIVSNKLLRII